MTSNSNENFDQDQSSSAYQQTENADAERPAREQVESAFHSTVDLSDTQVGSVVGDDTVLQGKDFGDYELIAEIARGGMGVVYKAKQRRLNRTVALKMILAGNLASESDVQRFRTEAESAGKLDHSGIVPIYEVGEHSGYNFFTMGYVEGATLASMVRDRPVEATTAATLMADIASAIHYAHQHNVIHRDLKPSNVLIDKDGRPKVTDFGLAKQTDIDSELTGTGQVLGTPGFMAPEQASGNRDRVGPTTDIYALGATLYCLLTTKAPFQLPNAVDTILAVINQDPIPPRMLNPLVDLDLNTICMKCLEKNPASRYESAEAFREELKRYLNGEPIIARPISTVARVGRWCRRNPLVSALLLAVALSMIVGTAASLLFANRWRQEANIAYQQTNRADRATRVANSERDIAKRQRDAAGRAQRTAERALARNLLDRGQQFCTQGDLARGLHWMVKSLKGLPKESDNLERLIRSSITAQISELNHLEKVVAHRYKYPYACTSDGQKYAVTTEENRNRLDIWDIDQCRINAHPLEHPSSVQGVCFGVDNEEVFVTCAGSKRIWRWNAATGAEIESNIELETNCFEVVAHPDGKEILVSEQCSEGPCRAFRVEIATGKLLGKPISFDSPIFSLAYSPDGTTCVLGGVNTTAQVYDIQTGSKVGPLLRHPSEVLSVAISPDGKSLATGDRQTVRLWEITTGMLKWQGKHEGHVSCLAFSHDGTKILSGATDDNAILWSAETGDPLGQPMEHGFAVSTVAFTQDDQRAVTGSFFRTRIWSIGANDFSRILFKGDTSIDHYVQHIGGNRLAISCGKELVVMDDYRNGEISHRFIHPSKVTSSTFSPNGDIIISTCSDNLARTWSLESDDMIGKPLAHVARLPITWTDTDFHFVTHPTDSTSQLCDSRRSVSIDKPVQFAGRIGGIGFQSKETQYRVVIDQDGANGYYAVQTGLRFEPDQLIRHGEDIPFKVTFSSDNQRVLVSHYHTVFVRNVASGETLSILPHHGLLSVADFAPNEQIIVTGGGDGTINVWDANDYSLIGAPVEHDGDLLGVDFSADSQMILSVSESQIRMIDLSTAKPIGWTPRLKGKMTRIGFAIDGKSILSTTTNGFLQQWDTPVPYVGSSEDSGREIATLTGIEMDDQGNMDIQSVRSRNRTRQLLGHKGTSQILAVTNVNDDGPGSLRTAINRANMNFGRDRIEFRIHGDAPNVIQLTDGLPPIVDSLVIDALSATGHPSIEIDGGLCKRNESGLVVNANDCIIRGLAINQFPHNGITLLECEDCLIEGNHFGTDLEGRKRLGNGRLDHGMGIHGTDKTKRAIIRDNVSVNNSGAGISLDAMASECQIRSNWVGIDRSGTRSMPNGSVGIVLYSGSTGHTLIDNHIHHDLPHAALRLDEDRNIIRDNSFDPPEKDESLVRSIREEATHLVQSGDLGKAISKYEELISLYDDVTDLHQMGHLLARTRQWAEAEKCFARSGLGDRWEGLLCLYESGDKIGFRDRLDDQLSKLKSGEPQQYHVSETVARCAQVFPIASRHADTIRHLARLNSPEQTDQIWRYRYVGPLMYRIGEFPKWYNDLPKDSVLRKRNKLLAALTQFQEAPSSNRKKRLKKELAIAESAISRNYGSKGDVGQHWHNYVMQIAIVREATTALDINDADEKKQRPRSEDSQKQNIVERVGDTSD